MSLSRLSLGFKIAVTLLLCNIPVGVFFAHIQIRDTMQGKDGEEGLSIVDVRYFFAGDPEKRVLQMAITDRTHWTFTTAVEKDLLEEWIADDAPADGYTSPVAAILDAKCVRCHSSGGERASSPLTTYEEVRPYTNLADTGVSYTDLARLSLFGILAMTVAGVIVLVPFLRTRGGGFWKDLLAFLPFLAILGNVLSWWSVKQSAAWVQVIVGSALIYGVLLAVMIAVVLCDMWLLPEEERRRRRLRRRREDRVGTPPDEI